MPIGKLWDNDMRLIDVFVLGPLQIYVSTFIKSGGFKYFMLLTGIINILFNGQNYLLTKRYIKTPLILNPFISKNGKHQLHRIYNLLIMYPIFLYIVLNYNLPPYLRMLFFFNIFLGFFINLYNYVDIQSNVKN